MARPTTAGSAKPSTTSKASSARRRQRDDSVDTASSVDDVSASSDDDEDDALPIKKAVQKATSAGRRIARDSDESDDEDGSDAENSRRGQKAARSSSIHGKTSSINNGRIDATTCKARVVSSSGTSNTSRKPSGSLATSSKAAMRPLQPSQHIGSIRGPAAGTSSAQRSPVRTVSLNAAQEHAKRRLSGKMPGRNNFSRFEDEGRRASLPSSLRKDTNEHVDGETSSASIASPAAARHAARSSAHNSPGGAVDRSRHHAGTTRPEARRTSSGVATHHSGVGALNAAAALHRQASGQTSGLANMGRDVPAPLPKLSQEAMALNYEEWMKMATDNVRMPTSGIAICRLNTPTENQLIERLVIRLDRLFP